MKRLNLQLRVEKIRKYLEINHVSRKDWGSCRKKNSLYGEICKYLKMQNSFKNRLLIAKTVERHGFIKQDAFMASTPQGSGAESHTPNFGNVSGIPKLHNLDEHKNLFLVKKDLFNDSKSDSDQSALTKVIKNDISVGPLSVAMPSPPKSFENDIQDCTMYRSILLSETSLEEKDVTRANDALSASVLSLTDIKKIPNYILPLNSNNLCNRSLKRGTFNECSKREGSFRLKNSEMATLLLPAVNKSKLNFILKQRIMQHVNNTCIINIKNSRHNAKGNYIVYGQCAHKKCKLFKITVTRDGCVTVYSNSLDYNHLVQLTSQVRSVARKVARSKLKHTKPLTYRMNTVRTINRILKDAGNLQEVKSDDVNRKIKSEAVCSLDRDTDDMLDVLKMRQSNKDYIQLVADPFQIHIFSYEQLLIVLNEMVKPIVYFDATGSIIKKPKHYSVKSCFYYAGVIQTISNQRICPVFEMLSCRHDSTRIGMLLADFKAFALQKGCKWPIFERIITDHSFALINSILYFWNHMSMQSYLQQAFLYVTEDKALETYVTPINICCSHYMKIICKDVDSTHLPPEEKRRLKEVLAAPFSFNDYKTVRTWWSKLVTVLSCEIKSTQFEKEFSELITVCTDTRYELTTKEVADDIFDSESLTVQYKLSPFHKDFKSIYTNVIKSVSTPLHGIVNTYYAPEFLKQILKKYIPYLPLWSGIMLPKGKRYSNAAVENWNSILKNTIMEKQRFAKPSRVIRNIRSHVIGIFKEIKYNIPKRRLTKQENHGDLGMIAEEKWKRKQENKRNFAYHKLAKLKEIKESEVIIISDDEAKIHSSKLESKSSLWTTISERNASLYTKPILPIFENGLVKDIFFYKLLPDLGSYNVAYYSIGNLSIYDYNSIDTHPTRQALDCCLHALTILSRKQNFKLLKCEVANETFTIETKEDCNIVYIPIQHKNEYKLVKMTRINKQVKFFNGTNRERKHFFLRSNFKNWNIATIKYPEGVDSGLYTLQIFAKEVCKRHIETNELRLSLLQLSSNVEKSCLICGFSKHSRVLEDWVQCEGCFRWLHFSCVPEKMDFKNREITYRCGLCELYLKSFTPVHPLNNKKQNPPNSSVVGVFNTTNYSHCQIKELEQRDLDCLNISEYEENMWLNNFIIDFSLGCIVKGRTDYTIINCNTADIIFRTKARTFDEAEILSEDAIKCLPSFKNTLIMPINKNNHWCVCLADTNNKIFTYIDPMGENISTTEKYKTYFLDTLAKYNRQRGANLSTEKWKVQNIPHLLQKDSYNCGVLIIMFMECIVNKTHLFPAEDPNTYRSYLKDLLIKCCNRNAES